MNFKGILVLALMILLGCMGCSNNHSITIPETEKPVQGVSNHALWGAFEINWDGVSGELTVSQSRLPAAHWNVTPLLGPEHIKFVIVDWDAFTHILTINATLTNPVDLDGYDVRGIITNAGGAVLMNPDDYTKLFDFNNPKVQNPFRAYAKDETNRKFWGNYANPDQYIHSEIFEIYFPTTFYTIFVITAAWPDNAPEPYDIVDILQSGALYETTGSIDVTIEVLDWQDVTASDVVIEDNPVTGEVHLTQTDATHWETTITNSGGVGPGEYELWVAAYDAGVSYPLYNKFTVEVNANIPDMGWSDPFLISGAPGVDEILPRLALIDGEYWVVYTEGTAAVARNSTNGGATWSAPTTIGSYGGIDTIHAATAAVGEDDHIYVQYQRSGVKYTYISKYDGLSWAPPVQTSYHGMTLPPYSCDLGIGADGYIYDMTTGDWSTFGFRSNSPWDITAWTSDVLESFYNGVYSINDGFVQNADYPKFFFVHDETHLDYAWYDGGWSWATARSGVDTLIEPAIAPESDGPYHCLIGVDKGGTYDIEYYNFAAWPPTAPYVVNLETGLTEEPIFHSISAEGGIISALYDADGEVRYAESIDGGGNFAPDILLAGSTGTAAYSHIRHDPYSVNIIAVYAIMEGGDYNIYARIKSPI